MSFREVNSLMNVCCDNCRHCFYENWGSENLPQFEPQCNKGYIVENVQEAGNPGMFNVEPNWAAHGTYEALTEEEKAVFKSGDCPNFEERDWD